MRPTIVSLLLAGVLMIACDNAPARAPAPAEPAPVVPPPATPASPLPLAASAPPIPGATTLHIEAVTRTLWWIEEPVLTEIVLELLASRVVCTPAPHKGCALGVLPEDSVLRRLGIEQGDVVRTLAGTAIGDGASLQLAMHGAREQGIFEVELQRGPETRRHRYRIRKLQRRAARLDNRDRALDLLAETIQRGEGDRLIIDDGAVEILATVFEVDGEGARRLLGIEDAEIVAVGDVTVSGSREVGVALRENTAPSIVLELVAEASDGGKSSVTLERRARLVDPAVLTAARASLPATGAGELDEAEALLGHPPSVLDPPLPFEGVTEVSETEYTMTREAFESITSDRETAIRSARIVPDRDGKGLKLYGLRRATKERFSLSAVGFKNGDLLTAVNGVRFTDLTTIMGALPKLLKAKSFEAEIIRKGKPMTLTIRIET